MPVLRNGGEVDKEIYKLKMILSKLKPLKL